MILPHGDRRMVLMAAGAAALAAMTGAASAQSRDIVGTVRYEGGAVIPEGRLAIRLAGSADRDDAGGPVALMIDSDGKSKSIAFSVPVSGDRDGSAPPEVVARLEREDGWLLARGSAGTDAGHPVDVTLYAAMH